MKIIKYLIILFLAFSLALNADAQKKKKKQTAKTDGKHHGIEDVALWKKVKIGDELMRQHSYYNAIDEYLEVEEKIPDNLYVNYKLAMSYHIARDYKNAEKFFKLYSNIKDNDIYPDGWFYYAETLKSQGKYEEAQAAYIKFSRMRTSDKDIKNMQSWAKNEINSCSWAMAAIEQDSAFINIIEPDADLNHAYSDFAPYPLGTDTLYFASLRADSVIKYSSLDDDKVYPIKTYITVKEDQNTWSTPKEAAGMNSLYEHTANYTIDPSGNKAYFSRCYLDRFNGVICSIYYKDKVGNGWGKAHKIHSKLNVSGYTTTQPTFEVYTKTVRRQKQQIVVMYFVSDRPGGSGGKDIWYVEIDEKGKFGVPTNAGKRINTPRDEVSPSYDANTKTLYFSSNYHYGLGGFDVFSAKGTMKRWSKPENMGMPINTSYDDTYYILIDKKEENELDKGYFVSNRPGGKALLSETCCDDIYYFEAYEPVMIPLEGIVGYEQVDSSQITASAKPNEVSDTLSSDIQTNKNEPEFISIDNALVGLVRMKHIEKAKKDGDSTFAGLEEYITWVDTTNANGNFELEMIEGRTYALVVKKEGYDPKVMPINETADLRAVMKKSIEKKVPAEKKPSESMEALSATTVVKDDATFVLENMYFDTSMDLIKKESTHALNLLYDFLKNNEGVRIEISGHTDSRGNDDYNMDLSQRRAERVMQYMIDKGIDEKRMTAKGYGETKPIASNDTNEGRRLNRRTEIKITSNRKR